MRDEITREYATRKAREAFDAADRKREAEQSSAALLREAAQTLRETAEGATPGPWRTRDCASGIEGTRDVYSMHRDDPIITGSPIACVDGRDQIVSGATAALIALSDPTFALAVAHLFDSLAVDCEDLTLDGDTADHALAVARAVLRRES